jgi:GPH family glycoside/pentoside/hexuronide:cation symporter
LIKIQGVLCVEKAQNTLNFLVEGMIRDNKLPFWRVALYSSASAGLNILGITISTWLLYFYAPPPDSGRITYIPAVTLGVLLLVATFWDAVIDPFIGHWSDSLRTRWGRRRPFLIFASPFILLGAILLGIPPSENSYTVNVVYFTLVILVYHTSYSLVGIPYDASMPEMAPETHARLGLSYWKGLFGIIGVLIGSLVAAPLFERIGAVAMGAVVGVVGVVAIYITLFGLKETDRPIGDPMPAIDGLKTTFQNKQFLILFVSTLFVHIAYQMMLANFPYFVTLVLGETESAVGIYQGVLIIFIAITGPVWTWFNRKYSQRNLLNASMLLLGLIIALGFLINSVDWISSSIQAYIFVPLIGAALGGTLILVYAMMGNVVDYDELLTNRRREAIYYGTFSFAIGLDTAVGTLILPLLLENFGFTRTNPLGVRLAFPVMAVFIFIGFIRKKPEYGLTFGTQAACGGDEARTFGSRADRVWGQSPHIAFSVKRYPAACGGVLHHFSEIPER